MFNQQIPPLEINTGELDLNIDPTQHLSQDIKAENEIKEDLRHLVPEHKISLDQVLQYAMEAKAYAQSQIKKGSTWLQNNSLSDEYFDFLKKGIGEYSGGVRDEMREQFCQDILEEDRIVAYYESTICVSSKYSLGNCEEMAFQALDYILNNVHFNINAEVYWLGNGDHAFLVINRDQCSNPRDPKTWGAAAVFCDPWADKVFNAKEYLLNVKNFYRYGNINAINGFNPSKHFFEQKDRFSVHYLRSKRSASNLKASFFEKSKHLINMLNHFKAKISKEEKRLKEKYDHNAEKILIISYQIKLINQSFININKITNKFIHKEYKNDYRFAKSQLMEGLELLNKEAVFAMKFSKRDQSILFEHKGENIKTEIMKFFGIKSKTYSHLKDFTSKIDSVAAKLF